MSERAQRWLAAFALIGGAAGVVSAVVLWLILTQPFTVLQAMAGWK
jgi:hypothetical protein